MKQSNWKTTFQWKQNLHRKYIIGPLDVIWTTCCMTYFGFNVSKGTIGLNLDTAAYRWETNLKWMWTRGELPWLRPITTISATISTKQNKTLLKQPPKLFQKWVGHVDKIKHIVVCLKRSFFFKTFFSRSFHFCFLSSCLERYTIFFNNNLGLWVLEKFIRKKCIEMCFIIQYSWRSWLVWQK